MRKKKAKRLFVDISEFSILAVSASGYGPSTTIEKIAEFPIENDFRLEDVNEFFEQFECPKISNYYNASCGIYPKDRFIHYYEAESVAKLKRSNALSKILESELSVNSEKNSVAVLNAYDGSDFDPNENATKELIFCGGPTKALEEEQEKILSYGLYPSCLELSSVAVLGGICHFLQSGELNDPIMNIELTANHTMVSILNEGRIKMTRSLSFGLDSLFPLLQEELSLNDEASAKKLFRSNTFDADEIGHRLLHKIMSELNSISGYYEVQTGLTIAHLHVNLFSVKLNWISKTISDHLGIKLLQIDLESWLRSIGVELSNEIDTSILGSHWLSVLSLMAEFKSIQNP